MNYALMHYGLPFPIALLYGVHSRAKQKYLYSVRHDPKVLSDTGYARWTAMNVLESVVHTWQKFVIERRDKSVR